MSNKSFIDLLFILLCGTIVMLSQSLQIGAVAAEPARVGGGGVSEVRADEVRVVIVLNDGVQLTDGPPGQSPVEDPSQVARRLPAELCVLLVARDEGVSHHRVMQVWSQFHQLGRRVKLGVVPAKSDKKEKRDV